MNDQPEAEVRLGDVEMSARARRSGNDPPTNKSGNILAASQPSVLGAGGADGLSVMARQFKTC